MKDKLGKYKHQLTITSIVTLLPILVGAILWNRLPNEMATHFGADNQANGWASKPLAVFGVPLLLLAVQWFVILIIRFDPRRRNISEKMFSVTLWIVPVCSLICSSATYIYSLGMTINVNLMANIFTGMVFVIIGNYLPKCKRSYTVGIKLPWTLDDEENWDKTHRFGGTVWVIGGLAMLVMAFLPVPALITDLVAVIALAALPMVYSFVYYLRHKKSSDDGPEHTR